jgi:hypothetical protein
VLLVNAYVCYVTFNLLHGKKKSSLLTHYQFREQICLALINPEEYETKRVNVDGQPQLKDPPQSTKKRKRKSESPERPTTRSIAKSMMDRKKSPKMTDRSLCPENGILRHRLDHTLEHWPIPKEAERSKCALHNWAGDVGYRAQVAYCKVCNVHLCLQCYKDFHTIRDIVKEKKNLAAKHAMNKEEHYK